MRKTRRDMATIKNQLMLQSINRWHIVPTVLNQTVADHTYGTMVIARRIWATMTRLLAATAYSAADSFPFRLEEVLVEALDHDLGEVGKGDTPRGEMDATATLRKFSKLGITQRIVYVADIMEALISIERLAPTAHGAYVAKYLHGIVDLLSRSILHPRLITIAGEEDNEGAVQLLNEALSANIMADAVEPWDYSVG